MHKGEAFSTSNIRYILPIIFFLCCVPLLNAAFFSSAQEDKYSLSIMEKRQQKDHEMETSPDSPFNRDSLAHFTPLKYFPVNKEYVFTSKLSYYKIQDTIVTFGTKGEKRKSVKIGYITFKKNGKQYRLNVYKGFSKSGGEYYSLWFTDKTTGKETYDVGRYLDFELQKDPAYVYTIDFNLAYNPYCSYSSLYSCAIPTKDNYLAVAIRAGEKKFHD